jgi:hypothetical protein
VCLAGELFVVFDLIGWDGGFGVLKSSATLKKVNGDFHTVTPRVSLERELS